MIPLLLLLVYLLVGIFQTLLVPLRQNVLANNRILHLGRQFGNPNATLTFLTDTCVIFLGEKNSYSRYQNRSEKTVFSDPLWTCFIIQERHQICSPVSHKTQSVPTTNNNVLLPNKILTRTIFNYSKLFFSGDKTEKQC